ncbi:hypothetical protein KKG66_10610, partial [bacterium]|nr:hypothetical protein [bacterium]
METRLNQEPFNELREFLAEISSLSDPKQLLSNQQITVRYSLDKPGPIRGEVFGTPETYKQFSDFRNKHGNQIRIKGLLTYDDSIRIESDSARITKEAGKWMGYPGYKFMCYSMAELEFEDIRIISKVKGNERASISYGLIGNVELINCNFIRSTSYDGSVQIEQLKQTLSLPECIGFKATIEPWFVWDREGDDTSKVEKSKHFKSINLTPTGDNIVELREKSTRLINDICLISSIGARAWVEWFRYSLLEGEEHHDYFRSHTREFKTKFKNDPL